MKIRIVPVFSALLFVIFTGCGSNVHLKGKVTFSDDDSPLPAGTVMFDSGSHNAFGNINPDGTFVVGSLKANDGLPPGNYKVCIAGAVKLLPNPDNVYPPPEEQLIDKRYEKFETSGLAITVDSSSKRYDFSIDRP